MKVEPNRVGQFPFRKADSEERKLNFSEVQQPYSEEEVIREADRCLLCGTPVCIDACPVLLDVRGMNEAVARGDFKTAYERIREINPLPVYSNGPANQLELALFRGILQIGSARTSNHRQL